MSRKVKKRPTKVDVQERLWTSVCILAFGGRHEIEFSCQAWLNRYRLDSRAKGRSFHSVQIKSDKT